MEQLIKKIQKLREWEHIGLITTTGNTSDKGLNGFLLEIENEALHIFAHGMSSDQFLNHGCNDIEGSVKRVFEFLYNPSCCESRASTMSIHRTKKGAEMAMQFHKNETYNAWKKECEDYPQAAETPFDYDQWWGVNECELLP